jgi:hypothetical protein
MAFRANYWFGFDPGTSWPWPIWPIDRDRHMYQYTRPSATPMTWRNQAIDC